LGGSASARRRLYTSTTLPYAPAATTAPSLLQMAAGALGM
jgi:hypothetical protein